MIKREIHKRAEKKELDHIPIPLWGFQGGARGKEHACQFRRLRDTASTPGSGRSPGGGHGNPLWYSYLKDPWREEPGGLQSIRSQRVGHD